MNLAIDYYFAPQSPWAFLGHERFVALAQRARRPVRVLAVDFGRIFSVSGGLPLGQRAAQRQAYRLVELRRFADHLGITMNVQPRHFPVDGAPAARLITAVGHVPVVVDLDSAGATGFAVRLTEDPLFGPVVSVGIDDPIAVHSRR